MSERVFLTHVVPKDKIKSLNVSAAANYFSYNLIDNNCFDQILSIVPPNIEERVSTDNNIHYVQKRFLGNTQKLKLINTFLDNLKAFFFLKKRTNLWYYNLTHQTVFLFLLIKVFKPSVKQFVILLDFTPSKKIFSLQTFIFKIINIADGIISLTANKFLTQKNLVVLPGIVTHTKSSNRINHINYSFILSGILSENRCPELILKIFSEFPEYELIITGKIDDGTLVEKYCNKFSNIRYLGFLDYDEYLLELEKATFSLNSRDPEYEENLYNFPSKSIEHLMFNKILISTMEYSELDGVDYLYVKPNLDDFRIFLNELKYTDKNHLLNQYANQSSKVFKMFGIDKWKESFEIIEKNASKT